MKTKKKYPKWIEGWNSSYEWVDGIEQHVIYSMLRHAYDDGLKKGKKEKEKELAQ